VIPDLGMNAARAIVVNTAVHTTTANWIYFGAQSSFSTGLVKGIMTPAEAYSMDVKLDDGKGGSGIMAGQYDASDASVVPVRCVDSFSSLTAAYNVQFKEATCVVRFKLN